MFPDSHIPAKTLGFLGSASCFFNVSHISYFFSCFSKNLIFYLMFFNKYQILHISVGKMKIFLWKISFCKNFLKNDKNPEIFWKFLLQILGKTSKENEFIVHKNSVIQQFKCKIVQINPILADKIFLMFLTKFSCFWACKLRILYKGPGNPVVDDGDYKEFSYCRGMYISFNHL